jgi:hypothetical protein
MSPGGLLAWVLGCDFDIYTPCEASFQLGDANSSMTLAFEVSISHLTCHSETPRASSSTTYTQISRHFSLAFRSFWQSGVHGIYRFWSFSSQRQGTERVSSGGGRSSGRRVPTGFWFSAYDSGLVVLLFCFFLASLFFLIFQCFTSAFRSTRVCLSVGEQQRSLSKGYMKAVGAVGDKRFLFGSMIAW